ncbi:MAG: NAD(P)/FAD-dependent oxidoreductase [Thermodesulfobacteriota bacterium]|nr:NAD(P)/FAD-dependent oxidoreductase [Thermodesulfobacteriota bacterium]
MEKKKYDIVIIGGGPNGLTAGAYLAKAGQKVLIVDRRGELGGACATENASSMPNFMHNVHAVYHPMVDYAPVYGDLGLEEYNLEHIYPSLQFAMPFRDGSCLCIYTDVDKTVKSIQKFSKKDAEAYKEVFANSKRVMEEFIGPATYYPAEPALDAVAKMQKSEVGREVIEWGEKSALGFVNDTFENEKVKALMLSTICMWGLDPEEEGLGYLIPLYINRAANYRIVRHGSHSLPQALNKVFIENGGNVFSPRRVTKIIVEGGEAKGIELGDGLTIEAETAVVSTLDTHQTFFGLVGEDKLDADFIESLNAWKWEHWSFLGVHLALQSAPEFSIVSNNGGIGNALIYILGYESHEDFVKQYKEIGQGIVDPNGGFNCSFPTVHDPSQAPPGKHVGIINKMVPFNLKDGGTDPWNTYRPRREFGKQCLEVLRRYAPNLTDDCVRFMFMSTPLDIKNKFLDMVDGSIKQGAYTALQMGYNRPNSECSRHRTPINNLFLGGACTYPGGTVLLGSGYLAANAVVEDKGINKWWKEPEMVTRAREKGLL